MSRISAARLSRTVVAACAAALVLAGAAQAGTRTFNVGLTPGTLTAGENGVLVTATVTNTSPTIRLGAVDLTAPASYGVDSAVLDTEGTSSVLGNTVRLRELDLQPGESAAVAIAVDTPCATGAAEWVSRGSQDQRFQSGGNNGEFTGAPARTTVTGGCSVAFEAEPRAAQTGATISRVDYDPAGGAVTVRLVNGLGQTADAGGGDVTVALDGNGSLSGTRTVTAVDGIASFADLSVAEAGDYRLIASAPGQGSDTSDYFPVRSHVVRCEENQQTCESTLVGEVTTYHVQALFELNLADATFLSTALNAGAPLQCYQGGDIGDDWLAFDAPRRAKRITMTVLASAVPPVAHGEQLLEACFSAPYPFVAKGVQTLEIRGGQTFNVGHLPDCVSGVVPPPCVESRSRNANGDGVIVAFVPRSDLDPYMRTGTILPPRVPPSTQPPIVICPDNDC